MKTEQTLQQIGEFRCTKCDNTENLALDSSLFKCAVCGGEECEMNFALTGRETLAVSLKQPQVAV
jgi:hypothetical protein